VSGGVPAHAAGVNRTYLSKLEKGASYRGLEIIAKLATVLEVEPAELLRMPLSKARSRGDTR
jgi:transcriptional regulator with XRE-family HTH domain